MKQLLFYTKPGCSLCDLALPVARSLAAEHDLQLTTVDVRRDPATFALYRYRIPVVTLDDVELGAGRIDPDALRSALEAALDQ